VLVVEVVLFMMTTKMPQTDRLRPLTLAGLATEPSWPLKPPSYSVLNTPGSGPYLGCSTASWGGRGQQASVSLLVVVIMFPSPLCASSSSSLWLFPRHRPPHDTVFLIRSSLGSSVYLGCSWIVPG
jgi:hypothetical protein